MEGCGYARHLCAGLHFLILDAWRSSPSSFLSVGAESAAQHHFGNDLLHVVRGR